MTITSRSIAAAWESALDLMLQELEPSEALRHPGVIEVFEAAGLSLTPDGVYRLAFGSNLKQQAHLRAPGSETVSTVVIKALRRVGIDVASSGHSQPAGLGAQPRAGSMTMAGRNEQVPAVCPKCSATLMGGRDLPGCWRCGWGGLLPAGHRYHLADQELDARAGSHGPQSTGGQGPPRTGKRRE